MASIQAGKEGKGGHAYMDYSVEAYGEGQLWLTLPDNLRKVALTIPPDSIRAWLIKHAPPEKYALLRAEIAAFNSLEPDFKMQWITMKPENRLHASTLEGEERLQFIRYHAHEVSFDPYMIDMPSDLTDNWRLF